MSAMRILLLGILHDQKPRHGYEIRQILESWNADKWANISYGSIYFALKKMAEEKLISVCEVQEQAQQSDKIVYTINDAGSSTFLVLLRQQWLEIKPSVDPFQVALTFMNYLDNNDLLQALEYRLNAWDYIIKSSGQIMSLAMKNKDLPKHINENHNLILGHYEAERNFIQSLIAKVKKGELP